MLIKMSEESIRESEPTARLRSSRHISRFPRLLIGIPVYSHARFCESAGQSGASVRVALGAIGAGYIVCAPTNVQCEGGLSRRQVGIVFYGKVRAVAGCFGLYGQAAP